MENEIWKDIINYIGLYMVSNWGRVKVLPRYHYKRESILNPKIGKSGYLSVCLSKNKKTKMFYVHRLVLEAFVGPCPLGMESRHLDNNQNNNKLENLKYDTHKNNLKDKIKYGTHLYGSKCPWAKLNDWQLRIIIRLLEDEYLSHREIAEIFNVTRGNISSISANKSWKHVSDKYYKNSVSKYSPNILSPN